MKKEKEKTKGRPFPTLKTKSGSIKITYRLRFNEIAEELHTTLMTIATTAGLTANTMYYMSVPEMGYVKIKVDKKTNSEEPKLVSSRMPKIELLIRLLSSVNAIAREKDINKVYTLSDLVEIKEI